MSIPLVDASLWLRLQRPWASNLLRNSRFLLRSPRPVHRRWSTIVRTRRWRPSPRWIIFIRVRASPQREWFEFFLPLTPIRETWSSIVSFILTTISPIVPCRSTSFPCRQKIRLNDRFVPTTDFLNKNEVTVTPSQWENNATSKWNKVRTTRWTFSAWTIFTPDRLLIPIAFSLH